jgi:hypothetical protein
MDDVFMLFVFSFEIIIKIHCIYNIIAKHNQLNTLIFLKYYRKLMLGDWAVPTKPDVPCILGI